MMYLVFSYTIKIIVSTFLIYLSIRLVDPGNYRNKLSNAFVTAVILSFAGSMPFIFFFGLIVWVYILINYYSIGFFKSFLCVFVYAVLFILLNLFLATALVSGTFLQAKLSGMDLMPRMSDRGHAGFGEKIKDRVESTLSQVKRRLPSSLRKKEIKGAVKEDTKEVDKEGTSPRKEVKVIFRNGGTITGSIVMEGERGYILNIADGTAEVLIRKEDIVCIEDL